uniref:Anaphase-promoting complex subunit 4 WD40 domain-containing protein n=1 Tax=Setaria digitata TaxID=48799 RepID=A0A915Q0H1_9BILA
MLQLLIVGYVIYEIIRLSNLPDAGSYAPPQLLQPPIQLPSQQSTLPVFKMSLIADLAWIKRGIPKPVPDKVKLSSEEIRSLIQEGEPETSELSDTDDAALNGVQQQRGIRGSSPDVADEGMGTDNYRLDKYDESDEERPNPLAGIMTFASPMEDPHITTYVDSDEEDQEDFEIKPDDNLVAVAKVDKNEYTLEVYLYNETQNDWYVHHDYILEVPPLCLEPIYFDSGSDDKKGNLLAIGNIDASVNIWDLDLVNSVEPTSVLGREKAAKGAQGHTDAVLSLAWNRLTDHVLASGSADSSVILWDLDEMKPATVAAHFSGMVQAVEWHPAESPILLTGTLSSQVGITDCRKCDSLSKQWEVSGHLYYMDTRKNEPVMSKKVHKGGARSIVQSCYTKGLLSTCGEDGLLKVWRLQESSSDLELITEHNMNLGALHICRFSPDSGSVLVVGGEKEEMVKVVEVSKFEEVQKAFS